MSITEIMEKAYKGIDGFKVACSSSSSSRINNAYGEILPEGINQLCEKVKFTKNDFFVDLGSGVGKMVTQIFLETGVDCKGIEINSERHQMALSARSQLEQDGVEKLHFVNEDLMVSKIQEEATIIYVNALSFAYELKESIVQTLLTHKNVRCVILVGFYPACPIPSWRFSRVEKIIIPMTFAEKMPVSICYMHPVEKVPEELVRLEKEKIKTIQLERDRFEQDIKSRLEKAMSLKVIDENSTRLKERRNSAMAVVSRVGSFVPLSSPPANVKDRKFHELFK